MNYIEVNIDVIPRNPWSEILIAELAEIDFESFVDTETGIQAYIQEHLFDESKLKSQTILGKTQEEYSINYSIQKIEHQNWNAQWEADFDPVYVEDKLSILAPFHDQSLAKSLNIIIQPQMSFGTGHHQTTWMMSKALLEENVSNKSILDMGTGTGVLAIIAEKLGAKDILAIDIEDWSVENTLENALRNSCTKITGLHGDVDLLEGKSFDIILANINKNVLKNQLPSYSKSLNIGSNLFMSGFFESDIDELIEKAKENNFKHIKSFTKENWAALKFEKE